MRDGVEVLPSPGYRSEVSQHARKVGLNLTRSVLAHPVIVIGVLIAFAALGYFVSSQQAERFTATARLFLSSSSSFDGIGQADFINDPDRYAINQADLMLSTPVLSRATDEGDLGVSVDDLRTAVKVTAGRGNDVLTIEATASSPTAAQDRANAVGQAYRSFKADEVEKQAEELVDLAPTDEDAASVRQRAAVYGDGVALTEQSVTPQAPSYPQPVRDGIFAAIIGLAVGVAAAVAVDLVSQFRKDRGRVVEPAALSGRVGPGLREAGAAQAQQTERRIRTRSMPGAGGLEQDVAAEGKPQVDAATTG